jgi:hypothetical protein
MNLTRMYFEQLWLSIPILCITLPRRAEPITKMDWRQDAAFTGRQDARRYRNRGDYEAGVEKLKGLPQPTHLRDIRRRIRAE